MSERFTSYTFGEGRTATGQLVSFSGQREDFDSFREHLAKLKEIELPATREVSVAHGGFGRYSRFNINQLKYAGGGGGYVEALQVENAPDDRVGNVIHEFGSGLGSFFTEFESPVSAAEAFELRWNSHVSEGYERFTGLTGAGRFVKCGSLVPWFYAVGDQALVRDFAFPDHLQEDPVYRFGEKFVVTEDEIPAIKTCLGARVYEISDWRGQAYPRRTIYWEDGSSTEAERDRDRIRPLEGGELWIADAMDQFRAMLAGQRKDISIDFADGTQFKGVIKEQRERKVQSDKFYGVVTFKDGQTDKGHFEFTPSDKYKTVEEFVSAGLKSRGEIAKMVIKKSPARGKNRWTGVFYNK